VRSWQPRWGIAVNQQMGVIAMAKIDDLRIEHPPADAHVPHGPWRAIALGLLVVILLGVCAAVWFWPRPSDRIPANPAANHVATPPREQPGVPAAAGTFTAGGYVEIIPPGPTAVTTRVDGWVRAVEVIEGQTVETGQVLVTLDDAMHRQARAEAEADVALAQAKLARLHAGFRAEEIADAEARYRQAQARLDYARTQVERYERLVEIGAAPSRQLHAARAELASAEADTVRVKAQFDLRRAGQRPEEIAVADAELFQAQTRLKRLQWQVDQCVIRAPRTGVVLDQLVRVGDWVGPAQGEGDGLIVSLFDPREVQVWVEVNQRDAGRVSVGQPVTLRADALRDQTVHGRVSRIMPKANLQRNTVQVKIELTDAKDNPATPEGLRPEMSVQVTFQLPGVQPREPGVQ
jgi:multidrug resistance efflux pump